MAKEKNVVTATQEAPEAQANGEAPKQKKDEIQYVYRSEAELKNALARLNEGKKVAFKGYRVTVAKPIPPGVHFVLGYSNREAQGQLMATFADVQTDLLDAPSRRAPTPEEAINGDPSLDDATRKALADLIAKARAKAANAK